jgi:hypothetical protein
MTMTKTRTPITVVACIAVVCFLVVSCEMMTRLPTGPSPSNLTAGLIVYEHTNYTGESGYVVRDISDLGYVEGPCEKGYDDDGDPVYVWDDCISSVRIAPGWQAHLYEHPDFGGWDQIVLEDVPNLHLVRGPCVGFLDDCVSSIRVFRQE